MKYWIIKRDGKYFSNQVSNLRYWSKSKDKAFKFDNKNFAVYFAIGCFGQVEEIHERIW